VVLGLVVAPGDEDGDGLAGVASAEEAVAVGGDAGESWVGFRSGVERGE
jgi:hypothetical protein